MSVKSLAAMFLFAASATAASMSLPDLRIEPIGGGSIFYVKNSSSQPLKGYLIELVDYPGSSYTFWGDADLQPVPPGGEKRIQVTNMTVGAVPDYVKMQAALYADGSTAGSPEKVTQLLERRHALLETTRELIRRFENTPPATLTQNLKQWRESIPAPTRADRNLQDAINNSAASSLIYQTLVALTAKPSKEVLATLRASESALAP